MTFRNPKSHFCRKRKIKDHASMATQKIKIRTFWDSQSWRPLRSQNVQADASIAVDIWMIYTSRKRHFWRLKRIVCWKVDCQEEHSALIWRFWRSHNSGLPMEKVITNWPCTALRWWITSKVLKFLKKQKICERL